VQLIAAKVNRRNTKLPRGETEVLFIIKRIGARGEIARIGTRALCKGQASATENRGKVEKSEGRWSCRPTGPKARCFECDVIQQNTYVRAERENLESCLATNLIA